MIKDPENPAPVFDALHIPPAAMELGGVEVLRAVIVDGGLHVSLRRAFDDLSPVARDLGTHGCEVRNFGDNWRSALGYGTPMHDNTGGDLGPLNEFRIQLVSGPNAAGSLGVSRGWKDPDPYMPACRDSPGGTWSGFGTSSPPGRRAAQ